MVRRTRVGSTTSTASVRSRSAPSSSLHWLSWYSPFFHGGSIGVDIFFVLSGFIITTMLWRSRGRPRRSAAAWWVFIRRRVVRLYPALLGLVVVAIVLYAVTPSAPLSPLEVARRGVLVLTQSSAVWAADQSGSFWLPALHPFGQTWSLAIEWYFYLLWPLVVLAARARGLGAGRLAVAQPGRGRAALSRVAAAERLLVLLRAFRTLRRAARGCRARAVVPGGRRPDRSWPHCDRASVAALAAIGAITVFAPAAHSPLYRYVEMPATVLATVVLIYAGYSNPGGPVHRLLSHRWLAGSGRASYSLYLWHIVPMLLLEKADLGLPQAGPRPAGRGRGRRADHPQLPPAGEALPAAPQRRPETSRTPPRDRHPRRLRCSAPPYAVLRR